jgi:hypothetical protein
MTAQRLTNATMLRLMTAYGGTCEPPGEIAASVLMVRKISTITAVWVEFAEVVDAPSARHRDIIVTAEAGPAGPRIVNKLRSFVHDQRAELGAGRDVELSVD